MIERANRHYKASLSVGAANSQARLDVLVTLQCDPGDWHHAKSLLDKYFKVPSSFEVLFSQFSDPRRSWEVVNRMEEWDRESREGAAPHSQSEFEYHLGRLNTKKFGAFSKLLSDANLPPIDEWPQEPNSFPFSLTDPQGRPSAELLKFLNQVEASHLELFLKAEIPGIQSIEFSEAVENSDAAQTEAAFKPKELSKPRREINWLAIVGGLAIVWFVYEVWFSGKYTGDSGGSGNNCRAQLERCLENQPERRWESYCQPRYYRCLNS